MQLGRELIKLAATVLLRELDEREVVRRELVIARRDGDVLPITQNMLAEMLGVHPLARAAAPEGMNQSATPIKTGQRARPDSPRPRNGA
jgi:hypothetical protein